MICLMCKEGEPLDGVTSVTFSRGILHLVIKQVPARVCPVCGEAYADEETATRLLEIARDAENAGEQAEEKIYQGA